MTDFLQYVIGQVKSKSLTKAEAISLLRQFEGVNSSSKSDLLHPLLHKNTSNLYEQRFSSTFESQDDFIANYVVNGQHMLPGMACLEIARAAVVEATAYGREDTSINRQLDICLKNVTWASFRCVGKQPVVMHIALYSNDADHIRYEIYSESKDVDVEVDVYAQGLAVLNQAEVAPALDLNNLRTQCSRSQIAAEQCYLAFKEMGIDYGRGYQCIENIFCGESQVLAKLLLPASISELGGDSSTSGQSYVLHPSLLEAAIQTAISFTLNLEEGEVFIAKPIFPTSLDELQILNPCPTSLWAWVKYSYDNSVGEREPTFDIIISDDTGMVCVQMLGLTLQAYKDSNNVISAVGPLLPVSDSTPEEDFELMTFHGEWKEKSLVGESDTVVCTLLCFASKSETQQKIVKAVKAQNPQARVIFISKIEANTLSEDEILSQNNYTVKYNERSSYDSAFLSVQEAVGKVDAILYLWGMEDPICIKDFTGIIYSLQALAASKLSCKKYMLYGQWAAENGSLLDNYGTLERCYLESWIGFERSLGQVLPDTKLSAIYHSTGLDKRSGLADIELCIQTLWKELKTDIAQSVLYHADKRYMYQVTPCTLNAANTSIVALRSGGTYLITGGCGGLGLLFAEHLAKTYSVNLILTGRSVLSESKMEKLKTLEASGSQVEYIQADVSDLESMTAGVESAKSRFGTIHGVIHAAGVENSQSVLEKEIDVFNGVLSSKIAGTLVLDEVLKHEPLDFICYFSSSSAILGDFGGCDYAIGNRFLMPYAKYRDQRVKQGECHGKSVVINWPLWREGGMGVESKDFTKMYLQSSGQRFLEADEGVAIFERLLQQEVLQHLVVVGRPSRVNRFLGLVQPAARSLPIPEIVAAGKGRRVEMKGFTLSQCIEWDLKELASTLLKIPRDRLHIEDNLAEFGFDSILLAQFARALSAHYELKITPALFFGYPTLQQLTDYFHKKHKEVLEAFYREEDKTSPSVEKIQKAPVSKAVLQRHRRIENRFTAVRTKEQNIAEPIAIIGMSGRFPQARTVDEMWTILIEGKEAVTEIPPDRFDWQRYYGAPQEGKTNCKWSGSLPGVAEFDPLFFEISPREAITMDPRQRLLLQESWRALEDAGYGATQINTNKIGMFVGVETGDYGVLAAQAGEKSGGVTANHEGILAARLSYVLNLSGPNMAINTACSSGLVAAHQACLSLRARECDTAIAAGVNILFRPESYVAMSEAGMLSEDGKCYTFDHRANGMVPGEAVAVMVFKRLSQAEAERDSIYAVIAGSGVNYDGKTNGITAPSGVAQARLLKDVYEHYRIDPETIEYIVAHGTGTKLGDPVEINALYDAFKGYTQKQGYCALTSTKTNFGHTFAASGLVSLISLVEAMRHETIPASLHCEQENDYINWSESPFYVNKVAKQWPARENKPRLGAVSAFGMSGTNAHMVVGSYDSPRVPAVVKVAAPYYLLALSAKTQEALREKVNSMIDWLKAPEYSQQPLANVSYTLLEGRQHFKHRCAIVVQERGDAIYIWQQLDHKEKPRHLFKGVVPREFEEQKALLDYAQELIANSYAQRSDSKSYQEALCALADVYCQGYMPLWEGLFDPAEKHCVHLPTYPFAKERYWVEVQAGAPRTEAGGLSKLHPLLHQNSSTLSEQRFDSMFTPQDMFVDQKVKGQWILPGMTYLEMACAAVVRASTLEEGNCLQLNNLVWGQPAVIDVLGCTLHLSLYSVNKNRIDYELYSELGDDAAPLVHGQGQVVLSDSVLASVRDLESLRGQCQQRRLSAAEVYQRLQALGLEYGSAYRCLGDVLIGEQQLLAALSLPEAMAETANQFSAHPCLLEAAVQAAWVLWMELVGVTQPVLPYAVASVHIYQPCRAVMWASVQSLRGNASDGPVLDIALCDEQGQVCVELKGLVLRALDGPVWIPTSPQRDVLMLQPQWRTQSITAPIAEQNPAWGEHYLMLCEPAEGLQEQLTKHFEGQGQTVHCLSLHSEHSDLDSRYNTHALCVFAQLQRILTGKPKLPVLVQVVIPYKGTEERAEKSLFRGLSGLLKSAHQENPKLVGQLIELEYDASAQETLAEQIKENRSLNDAPHVRYRNGLRQVLYWQEVELNTTVEEPDNLPWKDDGVYLITGGVGGLGLLFAKEIANRTKNTHLILTGRSALDEAKAQQLDALGKACCSIDYRQVDITERQAVEALVHHIQDEYGRLNGIIHGAGVIRDNFILNKTAEELEAVFAPKVNGLVNLDHASRGLALDFLVTFSSITGALGNVGQSDYAAANAFMDAYAAYRNHLVEKGQRYGRTVSINWPLWKDGGMHIDAQSEQSMEQGTGMVAMQSASGLRAFYQALERGGDQWVVIEGNLPAIREKLLGRKPVSNNGQSIPVLPQSATEEEVDTERLREKTLHRIKRLFGDVVKLGMEKIDVDEPLERYGIDSIMITRLNRELAGVFGDLSKTLFYEYQTLAELANYFLSEYLSICLHWTGLEGAAVDTTPGQPAAAQSREHLPVSALSLRNGFPVLTSFRTLTAKQAANRTMTAGRFGLTVSDYAVREPIAIIGVNGRYPQARNLEEYWQNLVAGKDCVTEIPSERWRLEGFFVEDMQAAVEQGKSYSKWGGFIEDFSEFDPLFFNISPRDALNIDPQERLFLQCCWHTLEDAGYTREVMTHRHNNRVGVFVGITKTGYNLYGPELWQQGEKEFPHTSFSSVANRFSYFMNLRGPSMSIDTMCSASLTAVHEACEHLYHGDCEIAIAGGVNLYLHPSTYVVLCALRMLSVDGRCKSFGEGGNGFVPGEGVGAVLLKPVSQAELDGDHIYATICGTSINHGGKTNGYTVPSPNAQGELVRAALNKSGLSARTISYIEAHGTGTKLGDPIEVTGLSQAFKLDTQETQFCALGSIKSNIGHLEAAAGIAGLTKIVLQMQHKQLVPSLHAKNLNTNIDFTKTPFVVQRELCEWVRPKIEQNGTVREFPRIAGISSFGAGGSNAHVIIEEYIPSVIGENSIETKNVIRPVILSAKNDVQLKIYEQQLLCYINLNPEINLEDLTFTLQAGREAMEERIGLVVESIKELEEKLQEHLNDGKGVEGLYFGSSKQSKEVFGVLSSDEIFKEAIDKWMQMGQYGKLVELWVKGVDINWWKMYGDRKPKRISLPVYPFVKDRYWIDLAKKHRNNKTKYISKTLPTFHSLLHRRNSELSDKEFISTFTGEEFFLKDHIIQGRRVLPGVAYLEMVRAAFEQIIKDNLKGQKKCQIICLRNIVWIKPIVVEDRPVNIHVTFTPKGNHELTFKVFQECGYGNVKQVVNCQGKAMLTPESEALNMDIQTLEMECNQGLLMSDYCYKAFLDSGIDYGPGFRGVDKIFVGKNQVLAKLSLPSSVYDSYADFELHPSIMDSALQASIGLIEELSSRSISERVETEFNSITKPSIPFALEKLEFLEKCSTRSWVWIRYTTSLNADKASSANTRQGGFQKLDIDLCDESGKICVKMRGFTSRTLEKEVGRILKKEVGVPGKGYPVDYYREKYSHPLVHKDNSTTNDILFTSVFTGEEFFLADHIVQGIKVLPGVAYLEMVRAAGELASQKTVVSLKSNVWLRPFQVYEEVKELSIRLNNKGHHYEFQVFSLDEVDVNATNVHFQGKILVEDESQGNSLGYINIQEIESRCVLTDHETINKVFIDLGFGGSGSGSSFHAMQKFRYNDKEGLAELQLPTCVKNGNEAYILHPSMMNVAFESVQLLYCFINKDKATRLPFSLRELWIHGAIPERAYAYVTSDEKINYQNSNSEYDIYITDVKGRVIVLFKGYVSLPLQNRVEDKKVVFATPHWQIKALSKRESNLLSETPIFILASSLSGCEEEIRKKWPESKLKILSSYKEDLGKWVFDNFIMVFNFIKSLIKESNNVSRPIFVLVPERESYIYSALSGLLRTAKLENPRLLAKVIELTLDNLRIPEFLVEAIQQEMMDDGTDVEIRFSDKGVREVKGLREVSFPSKHIKPINFQAGDIIWITGGFGGLGLLFAKYMGIEKKVKVILTGRSDFGSDKKRTLELLQQDGVDATYIQGDISNKDDVKKVVEQISNQYGKLTGIIHAAGINKDAYIFNKSVEEIQCVLEPKVAGILTLDEVTQSIDLKFMVLFSSLSAFGNAGQADYAGANSFLDAFADYRNQQVEQGKRYGKTISLNWPLWKEGGMTMDSQSEKMMEHRTGMVSMDTHVGIKVFESVLSDSYTQVIVAQGNIEKIRSKLFAPLHEIKDENKVSNEPRLSSIVDEKDNKSSIVINMVQQDLVNLASKMLRIEPEKINVTTELSNYGFDSIKYTEFSNQLNQLYKVELMPTELLAHSTLSSLRDYLAECYSECIVESHRDVACENNIQKGGQAETNVTENAFSDEDVIKSLHQELLDIISNILNIDPDKFDSEVELSSYGADSIKFTELANKLNVSFSLELMPTELFAHPTLLTLRDYLFDKYSESFHEKYNSFMNDENSKQKNKSKAEFSANNYRNGNVLKSVYKRLMELFSDILDMSPDKLDQNTELYSYGIDSIKFTELANQLNQIYSLELMPTELLSHPTISSLGQYLLNNYSEFFQQNDGIHEQAMASSFFPVNQSFYPELIQLNKNSKGRSVFWFHDGVGGVEIYRPIADKSSRPFYGIQAKGWMSDSQPLSGIQEIAKYYIEIIKSMQKQGPYDFGGFSLGGVIAYEVSRQLQDDDQIVDSIVMLDSPGTELLRQIYQDTKTAMLQAVNIYLRSRFSPGSKKYPNMLISNKDIDIDLKEDDFLNHLIALVKAKGLTISDEDIAKFINRYVKIQRYYELDKFCISSLKKPSDIKCFYFGNKSKVFFGSNEPYNTISDCDSRLNYENSWKEWGSNFKEFYYYEVDSLNHSEVITNPKSYDAIVKFCEDLYSDK